MVAAQRQSGVTVVDTDEYEKREKSMRIPTSVQAASAICVVFLLVAVKSTSASDGGIYGEWTTDAAGLPAYEYTLNQHEDDRAVFGREIGVPSRLHWHQIGNDRITAIATNDGWVQLYSHEHGPRWINHYRSESGAFAGGVSYLYEPASDEVWSTFYKDLPKDAEVRRIFGTGYFQMVVRYRDIELDRVVFAPFGDGRFLASRVVVRNRSDEKRTLRHGEYWDVWIHDITFHREGQGVFANLEGEMARTRDAASAATYAGYAADWDEDLGGLRARHPRGVLSNDVPFFIGQTPLTRPDVVCVPVGTTVSSWTASRAEVFGEGGRARPDGLINPSNKPHTDERTRGSRVLSGGRVSQGVGFLVATDLELEPGQEAVLGFGYGAIPPAEVEQEVAALGTDPEALFESTRAAWKKFVPHVKMGGADWLGRELAWGAYYVRSGSAYHEAYQAHTLPQGGVYQYLWGMNAGPRATLQHALPLIWLAPELASDAILFTMAQTHPEGESPYAEVGAGLIEPGHFYPSDNDLWLLWAVSEYVLGTRDRAFLRQSVSYWPAPYTRPEPVWDHCMKALDHLINDIGTGSHGLLRIRTGDWNDTLPAESGIPIDRVWKEGESTLNTAMAVYALRRFAELADLKGDRKTAVKAREWSDRFAEAVRSCWRGRHLNRGWMADDLEVGYKDLFLEPQPWALIAGVLDDDQARTLVDEIRERCADPLAARIFAVGGEGNRPTAGGGQWYSINSTLVWGYGKVDRELAWKELQDNTLHHHAEVYPEIWHGIWSGPDAYLPSNISPQVSGKTWFLPGMKYAMLAWPVQILFAHSEPLNSSLWLAGIVPTARGLRIDPLLPFEGWTWNGGLLHVTYNKDEVAGALGALTSEVIEVQLTLPSGLLDQEVVVEVAGRSCEHTSQGKRIVFRLPVGPGARTPFRVSAE